MHCRMSICRRFVQYLHRLSCNRLASMRGGSEHGVRLLGIGARAHAGILCKVRNRVHALVHLGTLQFDDVGVAGLWGEQQRADRVGKTILERLRIGRFDRETCGYRRQPFERPLLR